MKRLGKKLPDRPGVYFFKRGREILYIGKATSLRDRVRSYFQAEIEQTRGPRLVQMLALATSVSCKTTDSVLEALLLETELIKKHQPKYNSKAKDDKSFWFVVITADPWPRVLTVRGKDLSKQSTRDVFGPFPNAAELKAALKIIRKIFPWRDYCEPHSGQACFNYQLGRCPGVCVGAITPS
ncbi:MAG: GIY-YIG nuclease family protein, partial [Patescibacteria group bacterium]